MVVSDVLVLPELPVYARCQVRCVHLFSSAGGLAGYTVAIQSRHRFLPNSRARAGCHAPQRVSQRQAPDVPNSRLA